MPCGIPCRAGYSAVWDTVPCGIPCCAGYRAVRDTVPCGIPCRAGYRAVRDTVPCGIPCRAGYRAARDTVPRGIFCRSRQGSHAHSDSVHPSAPAASVTVLRLSFSVPGRPRPQGAASRRAVCGSADTRRYRRRLDETERIRGTLARRTKRMPTVDAPRSLQHAPSAIAAADQIASDVAERKRAHRSQWLQRASSWTASARP
jgi:hypothetical protein